MKTFDELKQENQNIKKAIRLLVYNRNYNDNRLVTFPKTNTEVESNKLVLEEYATIMTPLIKRFKDLKTEILEARNREGLNIKKLSTKMVCK